MVTLAHFTCDWRLGVHNKVFRGKVNVQLAANWNVSSVNQVHCNAEVDSSGCSALHQAVQRPWTTVTDTHLFASMWHRLQKLFINRFVQTFGVDVERFILRNHAKLSRADSVGDGRPL